MAMIIIDIILVGMEVEYMASERIGRTLKKLRKERWMTVEDVVRMLAKDSINIAVKTLYGWESAQAQPRAEVFLALCRIYGVTDLRVFNEG